MLAYKPLPLARSNSASEAAMGVIEMNLTKAITFPVPDGVYAETVTL